MDEARLKDYYEIYTQCWKLFKAHSNPDGSEEFWSGLLAEAEAIYKKYGRADFVFKAVNATIDEIKRIEKLNKKV